jgi:hypothetical protein
MAVCAPSCRLLWAAVGTQCRPNGHGRARWVTPAHPGRSCRPCGSSRALCWLHRPKAGIPRASPGMVSERRLCRAHRLPLTWLIDTDHSAHRRQRQRLQSTTTQVYNVLLPCERPHRVPDKAQPPLTERIARQVPPVHDKRQGSRGSADDACLQRSAVGVGARRFDVRSVVDALCSSGWLLCCDALCVRIQRLWWNLRCRSCTAACASSLPSLLHAQQGVRSARARYRSAARCADVRWPCGAPAVVSQTARWGRTQRIFS